MRVVSLLPAATEIVGALGRLDRLVAISHECDYPPGVNLMPRVTYCPIYGKGLPAAEVDRWVRDTLATSGSLYTLDAPLLRSLRPDVILTQRLCDVCAVGYGSVAALAAQLPGPPRIVNLEPTCLTDIFENIRRVAEVLEVRERGESVVALLERRVEGVRACVAPSGNCPRCFLMEWLDPVYCSGHWGPELVALAGGEEVLGKPGEYSVPVSWEKVVEARPEVLVLACCGCPVEETRRGLPALRSRPGWDELPAVLGRRVYLVNGCAYFSRPGPRIVDSLEILAEVIHPELFAGCFPDRGVERLTAREIASPLQE